MTGVVAFVLLAALTPPQQRGKQIYIKGEGSAAIAALTGADAVETPASVMPCANCHGYDGRGKPEGGVRPSDITADSLARASDGGRTNGRERPAYTRPLLKRAIAMGVDSGRHDLNHAMPRYRMSMADIDDLLSYLDILGTEKDPGVADDKLTIGVVVRPGAASVRAALEHVAGKINEDGIYGRRVELRFADSAKAFDGDSQPFALIDTTAVADATIELAERERMPAIVGARATPGTAGRYAFQLLGGLPEVASSLIKHAAAAETLLIVHDAQSAPLIAQLEEQAKRDGWRDVAAAASADAPIGNRGAVLYLGEPARFNAVVSRAAAMEKPPLILVPAALASHDLLASPAKLDRRIVVGFPTLPADDASRTAALAAASVLVDILPKLGRDVSRERFVEALQTLYRFETGFGPAVTWGTTRRHGTTSAYLMTVDLTARRLLGEPGWIE